MPFRSVRRWNAARRQFDCHSPSRHASALEFREDRCKLACSLDCFGTHGDARRLERSGNPERSGELAVLKTARGLGVPPTIFSTPFVPDVPDGWCEISCEIEPEI